nr:MAG TPA: hypothetical protein [Bacteriophage sp.]
MSEISGHIVRREKYQYIHESTKILLMIIFKLL